MKKIKIHKANSTKFSESGFYITWFKYKNKKLIIEFDINELQIYEKN